MGASTEEGSPGSAPLRAPRASMQSSTVRQSGPTLSSDQQRAMAPRREMRPKVGLRPATPHAVEGDQIEPYVSVPTPKPTMPAAVAAAGPALLPLDPRSRFQGLLVRPPNQMSP